MFKIDEIVKSGIIGTPKTSDLAFLTFSGRNLYFKQKHFGEGIVIAVVDTGVAKHPEFENRLLPGFNAISIYNNEKNSEDDNGHGTHVAGTIAGKTCGIAPKAQILPIKVLDGNGSGDIYNIINGLKFIKKWRSSTGEPVNIVNMSLTCPGSYLTSQPQLFEEFHQIIKDLVNMGILVVCAAGNTGNESMNYPSGFYEVVSVGAVDLNKQVAYFTTRNNEVDLCQIGVNVCSAWYKGGYVLFNGTSMATPMVSGISALISSRYKRSMNKRITEDFLFESLKLNTIDVGIPGVDIATGVGFCCLNPYPVHIELNLNKNIMIVNGVTTTLTLPPQNINGCTMIPLQATFESIGAQVIVNEVNKSFIIDN